MLTLSLPSMVLLGRSRREYATWLCLLLAVCCGGLTGCASGGSQGGSTPSGSYTVFVHATSGNVTQNATVTLYEK